MPGCPNARKEHDIGLAPLERIYGGDLSTSRYLLDNIRRSPVVKHNCRRSLTDFLGKLEAYQDSLKSNPDSFDSDANLDLF